MALRKMFKNLVFASLIVAVLVLVVLLNGNRDSEDRRRGPMEEAAECLTRVFDGEGAQGSNLELDSATLECTVKMFYSLPILKLEDSAGGLKYYLPSVGSDDACKVVTLGSESRVFPVDELENNYPQCTFLDVRPDNVAVESLPAGYEGPFPHLRKRVQGTVAHTGIRQILERAEGKDQLIDLLLVDVDKAESGVFEDLIGHLDQLPVICQMNVIIHKADDVEASEAILTDQFRRLKSKFVPLKFDKTFNGDYMTFWLNYADRKCTEKYLNPRL